MIPGHCAVRILVYYLTDRRNAFLKALDSAFGLGLKNFRTARIVDSLYFPFSFRFYILLKFCTVD